MTDRRSLMTSLGLGATMLGVRGLGVMGLGVTALGAASLVTPAMAQGAPGQSTFARIRSSKKLRIAGIVGTEPYYHKDLASGEWSGFCVSMARDLAQALEAELVISESTWGNTVLDLQADKIDIGFGLSPTPARALVLDFSRPMLSNTFTIVAKPGFQATTWEDLNKPEVRVAVDIGSSHDAFARRNLPKCTLVALKTADDAMLAVQSGRADCVIQVVMLALVTVKKNPRVGRVLIPTPLAAQPTAIGFRVDGDGRFRNYVDSWLEYNKSLGTIRNWIVDSLSLVGVSPDDIPANVQL